MAKCRSCKKEIEWMKTRIGRNCPVDAETVKGGDTIFNPLAGHVSHFKTCPHANDWGKKKGAKNVKGK